MGRVEKRMYCRRRGQRRLCRMLMAATIAVVALGLTLRGGNSRGFSAGRVAEPAPTAAASAFDESPVSREVALDAQSWYAIQTGIFSTREAAEEKAALYTDRGAPGYVCADGEKWRVFIACYPSRDDALRVRDRLSQVQGVETYLHTWVCPALTLRMTGMAGQVDVAEAGLHLLAGAAEQLRDAAARMDGGEISLQEARDLLAALEEQTALWLETAKLRFASPVPPLMQALCSAAEQAMEECRGVLRSASDGATQLSARMKLAAMAVYDALAQLRKNLMKQ